MKRYCVMYYEYGLTRMAVRNFFTEVAATVFAAFIRRTHGNQFADELKDISFYIGATHVMF